MMSVLCLRVLQHEVEICRSEQPFVIQSRCAAESFTATDSHLVSTTADDNPLAHDSEVPGPSCLSGQSADDTTLSSAVDISDIVIKSSAPSKSEILFLFLDDVCICCCILSNGVLLFPLHSELIRFSCLVLLVCWVLMGEID